VGSAIVGTHGFSPCPADLPSANYVCSSDIFPVRVDLCSQNSETVHTISAEGIHDDCMLKKGRQQGTHETVSYHQDRWKIKDGVLRMSVEKSKADPSLVSPGKCRSAALCMYVYSF